MTTKPTILFIEDEDDHFDAISSYLNADFNCVRFGADALATIGEKAAELNPTVAVVDLMLFSSSDDAKEANRGLDLLSKQMDEQGNVSKGEVDLPKEKVEQPKNGAESIPVLRESCPGILIAVFSQQLDPAPYKLDPPVDAELPKKIDTDFTLENGKELADKVRELAGI